MKILAYDVENLPMLTRTWNLYDATIPIQNIVEHASLICVSWKFVGQSKVFTASISDDPAKMDKNIYDDEIPARAFHKVLNSDEEFCLLAHNGDRFDMKKLNTSFVRHGLEPVPDRKSIDTLREARRAFSFDSNKLDYIGRFFGVGGKLDTGGDLWGDIVQYKYPKVGAGKDKDLRNSALRLMEKYNRQDVNLLEKVFNKMRPFIRIPNALLYSKSKHNGEIHCPDCRSSRYILKGFRRSLVAAYQRYRCLDCSRLFTSNTALRKVSTR